MTTTTKAMLTREVENGVATLALNHPPANTLTLDLLLELEAAFDSLAADSTVRAIIVTGSGADDETILKALAGDL